MSETKFNGVLLKIRELETLRLDLKYRDPSYKKHLGKDWGPNVLKPMGRFRVSFINKLQAIKYHMDLLNDRVEEYGKMAKENKSNVSESALETKGLTHTGFLLHAARSETTFLMEDIVYHSLSCLENLSLLIKECYKDGNGRTMNSRVKSIKFQVKDRSTKLGQFLFTETGKDSWVMRLYLNRADIYHTMSSMNDVSYIHQINPELRITKEEKFEINLPDRLKEVFYERSYSPTPLEFCDKLNSEVCLFCYNFLVCVLEDYNANRTRMKI